MNADTENKDATVIQPADVVVQPVEVPVDADAEKRSGVKEIAQNSEAIVAEKDKPKDDNPPAKPSFFIKKSARHVVKMDVLTSKEDGRIVSVSKTGLGIDFEADFPYMVHTELRFDFSLPNYEDMATYRQRSSVYRREAQQVIVDKLQLRNLLVIWHLKDWNVTDADGKKVVLTFDPSGVLSDESIAMVYAMSPTLMDVVMTTYEKEALLS